jgi:hypothetical protein
VACAARCRKSRKRPDVRNPFRQSVWLGGSPKISHYGVHFDAPEGHDSRRNARIGFSSRGPSAHDIRNSILLLKREQMSRSDQTITVTSGPCRLAISAGSGSPDDRNPDTTGSSVDGLTPHSRASSVGRNRVRSKVADPHHNALAQRLICRPEVSGRGQSAPFFFMKAGLG